MRSRARTNASARSRGAALVARRLARINDDSDSDTFAEDRVHMVEEAALSRAQRRGATDGFDFDDWLAAEDEIDQGGRAWRHGRIRRSVN